MDLTSIHGDTIHSSCHYARLMGRIPRMSRNKKSNDLDHVTKNLKSLKTLIEYLLDLYLLSKYKSIRIVKLFNYNYILNTIIFNNLYTILIIR